MGSWIWMKLILGDYGVKVCVLKSSVQTWTVAGTSTRS